MSRLVVLTILDGYGLSDRTEGNAIYHADTPFMSRLFDRRPRSRLRASGRAVGLPEGQIGNSEVGHMNLGAGRIVHQPLTRINEAIASGEFFENDALLRAFDRSRERGATLHLMGLLSDGGVHSHIDHLRALLEMAGRRGVENVAVHAFLDGRDVPPQSAEPYLSALLDTFEEYGVGELATLGGRYYGMDRDNRWDRTERAYRAMVPGEATVETTDPIEALHRAYEERDETDEFVQPTVVLDGEGRPRARITDDDAVIFFNFRPDRARQITRALTEEGFDEFSCDQPDVLFVCMTRYDDDFDLPVAFPPLELTNGLTEYLSRRGLRQYHTAETEKYAHVTFFFNGGEENPYPGEERKLIPSPRVATYDLQPEMSAPEVTDTLVERIRSGSDDFVVVNYANPDMVGHTGDFDAVIEALECLDGCLRRLWEAVESQGGEMLITSDHGNAEQMVDPATGSPHTAHTVNDCPFLYLGPRDLRLDDGTLADVAPTVLALMGLPVPDEMEGRSLIRVPSMRAES